MKAVFDTNILIDFLNGVPAAKTELARYKETLISTVTYIELLVGAKDETEEKELKEFMHNFRLVPLNRNVAQASVTMQKAHKLKVPDAIIMASADVENALLVTRNIKDFPADDPGVRIPYKL